MPEGATLQVKGYTELLRALQTADKDQKRLIRAELKSVGDAVKQAAASITAAKSGSSAAGYRTAVRQRGVAVTQSRRKTTGVHPEWGSWMMRRALIPSVWAHADDTERRLEQAMDRMAAHFNGGL